MSCNSRSNSTRRRLFEISSSPACPQEFVSRRTSLPLTEMKNYGSTTEYVDKRSVPGGKRIISATGKKSSGRLDSTTLKKTSSNKKRDSAIGHLTSDLWHSKKVKQQTGQDKNDGIHFSKNRGTRMDHHHTRTIYVSNIQATATEEDIRKFFTICGEVLNVTMINQISSGVTIREAKIEYSTKEAADKALILNQNKFVNTDLKITPICHSHEGKEYEDLRVDVLEMENEIDHMRWNLELVAKRMFENPYTPSIHEAGQYSQLQVQNVIGERQNNVQEVQHNDQQPVQTHEEEDGLEYFSATSGDSGAE